MPGTDSEGIRLNKYIASSGLCSRREADTLIESGKVTINGIVAVQGTKVNDGDIVEERSGADVRAQSVANILGIDKVALHTLLYQQIAAGEIGITAPDVILPLGQIGELALFVNEALHLTVRFIEYDSISIFERGNTVVLHGKNDGIAVYILIPSQFALIDIRVGKSVLTVFPDEIDAIIVQRYRIIARMQRPFRYLCLRRHP